MPQSEQPISYYVEEAKRLGLSDEQVSVIGDETDGQTFREHIANAHDKSDAELRDLLEKQWSDYSADHSGEDGQAKAFGYDSQAAAEDEANGRHVASAEAAGELDGDDSNEDEEEDDSSSDLDDLGDEEEDDSSEDETESEEDHDVLDDEDDDFNALDDLNIDEEALERKRDGGGEALDDDEADCEGCKI